MKVELDRKRFSEFELTWFDPDSHKELLTKACGVLEQSLLSDDYGNLLRYRFAIKNVTEGFLSVGHRRHPDSVWLFQHLAHEVSLLLPALPSDSSLTTPIAMSLRLLDLLLGPLHQPIYSCFTQQTCPAVHALLFPCKCCRQFLQVQSLDFEAGVYLGLLGPTYPEWRLPDTFPELSRPEDYGAKRQQLLTDARGDSLSLVVYKKDQAIAVDLYSIETGCTVTNNIEQLLAEQEDGQGR